MNLPKKYDSKLDPDYKITDEEKMQIKIKEEKDNKEYIERIKTIINREFNRELKMKENQLELIQQRILKTQKTLHLLRYVLVSCYYNNHQLNTVKEEDSNFSNQNRIHPAIKKLLGKNSSKNFLNDIMTRKKRKKDNFIENMVIQESIDSTMKQNWEEIQSEIKSENPQQNKIPTDTSIRSRNKIKHRLIVGNISKWMPSENEEDNSTHKWMVYVRGPKEEPTVSHIINKIVFYLHPSYKPNDVVEVTESPFHLSRRGWGEFPLRLKIYFQCTFNKPVDIIHNLKLDQTCCGRQTLGNETLVDVYLYDTKELDKEENFTFEKNVFYEDTLQIENTEIKQEIEIENTEIKQEIEIENTEIKEEIENNFDFSINESNMFFNEIDAVLKENSIFAEDIMVIRLDHSYAMEENEQNIIFNDKKRRQCEELANQEIKKSKLENICLKNSSINFNSVIFNNMLEALPFLLKRLPLIHKKALDNKYKRNFPFTASSIEEYTNWNDMKKISCEWSRAKLIKNLTLKSNFEDRLNWSTKNILWYARTHGFVPSINYKIFLNNSFNREQLLVEKESRSIRKTTNTAKMINIDDVRVNVTDFETDARDSKTETAIDYELLENNNEEIYYSFVRQTALDVGVICKSEELCPGININGVERMLLVAMKCLAENIIRDTKSTMILEGKYNETTGCITNEDIYHSLRNTRLDILLK